MVHMLPSLVPRVATGPNRSFLRTLFCLLFSLLHVKNSELWYQNSSNHMWKLPLEKYALKPDHPFEEDYASCQMAIIPENFYEEADKGMIRFKKTPKWCFCDEGIGFEDGTTLEADVVILATGYDGDKKLKAIIPEPFPSWLEFPWGEQSNVRASELRSMWLNRLMDEKFKLPSKEKMLYQFYKEMEVMKKSSRFYKNHCISTFSIQHADDLM
ncbi:hypothetical protein HID58_083197 [Brassica napus]|uniref:Flavin-containing monooxygenase n=1 Tax=Brassica napus TaxID=3708 RepID=A0ABQ7YCN9_BRANA|nr:hypothetical protein HID58_083197 [Brassica napus]